MKLSEAQFREQLVDYLYGELRGEQLAAFEASLAASEAQRRELAALEQTLGVVRDGLHGALAEQPPSRVRTALLAAAASELAARGSTARAVQAQATRATTPSGDAGEATGSAPSKLRSLARRLVRHPVLYPALGIAAVFALVVLGKRVEHERYASESVDSLPASEREELARGAAREPAAEQAQPSAPSMQFAEPPPVASASDEYARRAAAPTGGLRQRSGGGTSVSDDAPKKGRGGAFAPLPGAGPAAVAKREQPALRPAQPPAEAELREGATRAARAAERDDESFDTLGGIGAPASEAKATAGARRAAPAAPAASADKSAVEEQAEPAFAAPPPARAPAKRATKPADGATGSAGEGVEELARRASEQLAAGHFREASAAYRALLARFPNDTRAASWRKELARAQQALEAEEVR